MLRAIIVAAALVATPAFANGDQLGHTLPACSVSSFDGFANVRAWPYGPFVGPPAPNGTPIEIMDTWFDWSSGEWWSRVIVGERGVIGVVARSLVWCPS